MGIQENIEHSAAERAKFREMKEGTAEDWAIIGGEYRAFAKGLPDRVLDHLKLLDGDFGGFPLTKEQGHEAEAEGDGGARAA